MKTHGETMTIGQWARPKYGPRAVMGLDLSLRGSAMVVLESDWTPGTWKRTRAERFTMAGLLAGDERVAAIVEGIHNNIGEVGHAFVEQHAFSAGLLSHAMARAELVGAVKRELFRQYRITVVPVVASSARKTLFGKQPRMSRKEWKRFIWAQLDEMGAPFEDEDTRDAFVIANAGWMQLGRRGLLSPTAQ